MFARSRRTVKDLAACVGVAAIWGLCISQRICRATLQRRPTSALQPRYPRYFTADFRIGEDFNVGSKHAVRISLTIRNLTNHTNPLQVHNNSGDPLYGTFFGGYGRHFIPDFDFLF